MSAVGVTRFVAAITAAAVATTGRRGDVQLAAGGGGLLVVFVVSDDVERECDVLAAFDVRLLFVNNDDAELLVHDMVVLLPFVTLPLVVILDEAESSDSLLFRWPPPPPPP